ncbi:MAG TPA: helix-turn-helix transcriptional regulator [Candidatus Angelobacter sp.]|nr:helix-turn-helix transcriptional regulator [Candidatus Angelobacter sp.]
MFRQKEPKDTQERFEDCAGTIESIKEGTSRGAHEMTKKLEHKTVKGNIFDALGFDSEEALDLKLRSDLLMIINRIIARKKFSARQLQEVLHEHQPRISELLNGKLDKLSLNRLVRYVAKLGQRVEIRERRGSVAA